MSPAPNTREPRPTSGTAGPTYWLCDVDGQLFSAPDTIPPYAEAVIIGGGLMGVATAYWLARRGLDVLLAEAQRLAWGATGRNAGMFLSGLHPIEDGELVSSVLSEERIEAGYDRIGHLALAGSPAIFSQVQAEVARRPPGARPLHVLGRDACQDLLGMRIAPEFTGGRWMPDGQVIHPAKLVYGLAAAAMRRGAIIATQTRVNGVHPADGKACIGVETTRGRVEAECVVYACNSAITGFHPELRRFVAPKRGQVMATDPLPPIFRVGMAVDYGNVYWRQAGDGTLVIGGCRSSGIGAEENSAQERVNPRIQGALDAFLPHAFPGFPPFTIRQRWAGIMDCTIDGRPVVGALPHADGQWAIGGFGGHGLPGRLGAGKALAEAVATGRPPALLAPFDPGRLLTNHRLRG